MGCGAGKPQRLLLRVASQGGGSPVVDAEYSAPGRGAYLCFDGACLQRAKKRRALERALKLREGIPRELWEQMEQLQARRSRAQ